MVGGWVYENFDEVSGIHSYHTQTTHTRASSYQDCTQEEYQEMLKKLPTDIDWPGLGDYEKEDNTSGTQTFACSGDHVKLGFNK